MKPLMNKEENMAKRMLAAVMAVSFSLALGGCVSMGKYEQKEQEALHLGKDLQDLQQRYSGLTRENEGLKARVEKLSGEVEELDKEKEKLIADNKELDILKAKTDSLSQTIAELQQKIADLEKGNVKGSLPNSISRRTDMTGVNETGGVISRMPKGRSSMKRVPQRQSYRGAAIHKDSRRY